MGLISHTLSSLFGGVSQQAPALRLDNQCEAEENAFPTIAHGVSKRPHSEFLAKLTSGADSDSLVHVINRDANEQYVVIFTGSADEPIEIFDLAGVKKTVDYGVLDANLGFTQDLAKKAYAVAANPRESLRATTCADYTMVSNGEVTAVSSGVVENSGHVSIAIVNVKRGVAGTTYKVFVNGAVRATYSTGDTNNYASYKTDNIAAQLYAQLNAWATGDLRVVCNGSVVIIYDQGGADFTFSVEDSWGMPPLWE